MEGVNVDWAVLCHVEFEYGTFSKVLLGRLTIYNDTEFRVVLVLRRNHLVESESE